MLSFFSLVFIVESGEDGLLVRRVFAVFFYDSCFFRFFSEVVWVKIFFDRFGGGGRLVYGSRSTGRDSVCRVWWFRGLYGKVSLRVVILLFGCVFFVLVRVSWV